MTVGRLIGFRFLNSENAQRQLILAAAGVSVQLSLCYIFIHHLYMPCDVMLGKKLVYKHLLK